jgi:hypothetical protein
MDTNSARDILRRAVQETASTAPDLEGAFVVGFIAVAEWMTPSGQRWLSRVDGGPDGGLPEWQRHGYLHNALFSDGFDDDGA